MIHLDLIEYIFWGVSMRLVGIPSRMPCVLKLRCACEATDTSGIKVAFLITEQGTIGDCYPITDEEYQSCEPLDFSNPSELSLQSGNRRYGLFPPGTDAYISTLSTNSNQDPNENLSIIRK